MYCTQKSSSYGIITAEAVIIPILCPIGSRLDGSVQGIGDRAFANAAGLKALHLPKSVWWMDRNVFQRLWREVRYLARAAVAGSEQQKQLIAAKNAFIKAWHEETKNTAPESGVGYSLTKEESDGVKEQLRKKQEQLNIMNPVASINDNGWRNMSTGDFRKKIVSDLQKTGFMVDRKGFGVIEFSEKELNRSLNYIVSDAESAAYQALPQVLKRGIEIGEHTDHKGRGYGTITIAAPIILNGERANMAVVVMQTKGNRYKVHRILTPDGNTFSLSKKANAESTSADRITEGAYSSGGTKSAINSASKNIIDAESKKVNTDYSLSKEGQEANNTGWGITGEEVRRKPGRWEFPIGENVKRTTPVQKGKTVDAFPIGENVKRTVVAEQSTLAEAKAQIAAQETKVQTAAPAASEENIPALDFGIGREIKALEAQLADKDAFVSKQARKLYNEIRSLKTGVKASKELGYLLDMGYEWRLLSLGASEKGQ